MDKEIEESIDEIKVDAFEFSCPYCDKTFIRLEKGAIESNIENHIKSKHSDK